MPGATLAMTSPDIVVVVLILELVPRHRPRLPRCAAPRRAWLVQPWVAMEITPLDATLGAVVTDVHLADLREDEWPAIDQAFNRHAVLVFPGQHLTSAEQIAFARRFGEIEVLFEGYDAVPISTVDQAGEVMAPDHPVMQVVRGNQGWHTDSSYMPVSAKASMLSAQVVPARAATPSGPTCGPPSMPSMTRTRARIGDLCAYHSIAYSQAKAGFDSTSATAWTSPPSSVLSSRSTR